MKSFFSKTSPALLCLAGVALVCLYLFSREFLPVEPHSPAGEDTSTTSQAALRKRLDPLLLELQDQVRLDFAAEFPHALRDDLKEELALSLEALVVEAYASAKPPHPEWLQAD